VSVLHVRTGRRCHPGDPDRAVAGTLTGLAVDAAHMLAIALPELAGQEEWTRRGLALADGSTDPLVPGIVSMADCLWGAISWFRGLGVVRRSLQHASAAPHTRPRRTLTAA